jgi:hypothetical protein
MKIKIKAQTSFADWDSGNQDLVVMPATRADQKLLAGFLSAKAKAESKSKQIITVDVELTLPTRSRSFRQNNSVWVLVEAIFISMEGRKPTKEESYSLYIDLIETYAVKKPNQIREALRPVHISEADVYQAAYFIEGLIYHLATYCDLPSEAQIDVINVLAEWTEWRGSQERDPLDYKANGVMVTEWEWRSRHVVSDASGRGGTIERAHIVSRGADHKDIEASWNWIALTPDEHQLQHQKGWDVFLVMYPHLRGRVERARKLAFRSNNELETE